MLIHSKLHEHNKVKKSRSIHVAVRTEQNSSISASLAWLVATRVLLQLEWRHASEAVSSEEGSFGSFPMHAALLNVERSQAKVWTTAT